MNQLLKNYFSYQNMHLMIVLEGNVSDDLQKVFNHFPVHRWVVTTDMKDAMTGLLRIHFVYDFDTRMVQIFVST